MVFRLLCPPLGEGLLKRSSYFPPSEPGLRADSDSNVSPHPASLLTNMAPIFARARKGILCGAGPLITNMGFLQSFVLDPPCFVLVGVWIGSMVLASFDNIATFHSPRPSGNP